MNLDFNGRANGFYNGNETGYVNGKWMESEFGKRLDYNEWMMGYKIILITKNEFNI